MAFPMNLNHNPPSARKGSSPDHESNLYRKFREARERCWTVTLLNGEALLWIGEFEGEEGELFCDVFGILDDLSVFKGRVSATC
jgi:hypothetical protein